MADKYRTIQTGNALFEAFVEQIKQVLDHLYDFAYLQQHLLARFYDKADDSSAKTAGRQLRFDLIAAIESLKAKSDSHFRAPEARLYNLLHLVYVENLTIQEVGLELGISERQTYRDLKHGQEAVAASLWNARFPSTANADIISLQSEIAHLKLNFSTVAVDAIFWQARKAVERLAVQQAIEIVADSNENRAALLTDPLLAHQMLVSILSYAIQQAQPGQLIATFDTTRDETTLVIRYHTQPNLLAATDRQSVLAELAQRLHWTIAYHDTPDFREVRLRLMSHKVTILVIDDNEGWVALLERFLERLGYAVVTLDSAPEAIPRVLNLRPNAIILDVMMPGTDGWEMLQRLRTQPETSQIPVVVCSVFNDPQLAYSLGASAFVPKSTNLDKIAEALSALSII